MKLKHLFAFVFIALLAPAAAPSASNAITIPDGAIGVTKQELRKIRKAQCFVGSSSSIFTEDTNGVCSKTREKYGDKVLFNIKTGEMYRIGNEYSISEPGMRRYLPDGLYHMKQSYRNFRTNKRKKMTFYAVVQDGRAMILPRKKGMFKEIKRAARLGEFITHVDPFTLALYKQNCNGTDNCSITSGKMIYSPDERAVYMNSNGFLVKLDKKMNGAWFREFMRDRSQKVPSRILNFLPNYYVIGY